VKFGPSGIKGEGLNPFASASRRKAEESFKRFFERGGGVTASLNEGGKRRETRETRSNAVSYGQKNIHRQKKEGPSAVFRTGEGKGGGHETRVPKRKGEKEGKGTGLSETGVCTGKSSGREIREKGRAHRGYFAGKKKKKRKWAPTKKEKKGGRR